jgi:hypothetical protein
MGHIEQVKSLESEVSKLKSIIHDLQESAKDRVGEVSALRKGIECVYIWLANSQNHEKCKNNPFPDGIIKDLFKVTHPVKEK